MQKIKGKFIFLILIPLTVMMVFRAEAFSCIDKRDGKPFEAEGVHHADVTVPVDMNITEGYVAIFDLSNYYTCKNTYPSRYIDYMSLKAGSFSTNLGDEFETYFEINGVKYKTPVVKDIQVYTLTDGHWHDISIKYAYALKERPNQGKRIKKGDVLARLTLYKWSKPLLAYFTLNWKVIAGNDAFYTAGTCDINEGKDIDVNFGQISRYELSNESKKGASSVLSRHIYIPYKCKEAITEPIKMTLSATSSFNGEAIKTSNARLGVKVFHKGKLLKPFESINSNIVNGVGGDNFTFSLVTEGNASIDVGAFNASAVLVMSVQ